MAQAPTIATMFASAAASSETSKPRDITGAVVNLTSDGKLAAPFLTPPNSVSPDLPAYGMETSMQPPPSINITQEQELQEGGDPQEASELDTLPPAGIPLSRTALSGLDAAAAITPAMLAKYHLPGIMLGNGPRPIRQVMYELTQSVPGFSSIQPAKARRLVVAALESRHGGGLDGNVTFCKTGWGRWDAHIKGSSKDSAIGSFKDGHISPPRSERSSYAYSNGDSGVQMRGPEGHRGQRKGGSWSASDLREEDELDMEMDMDVPEHEADKMSLDEEGSGSVSVDEDDSSSENDDTDDDDWAAAGPAALRKASLPTPGAPRINYNAISIPLQRAPRSWMRRPSAMRQRPLQSASLPHSSTSSGVVGRRLDPSTATPEEKAAVAALLSLGGSV